MKTSIQTTEQTPPNHSENKGLFCGKCRTGIMKSYSQAKLNKPLLQAGTRGDDNCKEVEWNEAPHIATARLAKIRETKKADVLHRPRSEPGINRLMA